MMREAKLGDFVARGSRGIVPNATPDTSFELYSVPAFDAKNPEIVPGSAIGSNKQIVEPGTVLLCKINPRINRAWTVGSFTNQQKIASTEWITFPPHPEVEPRYLAHYLSQNKIRDYLAANASGVGGSLMRVKSSTLEDLPLPLPDPEEQRLIVAELEKQFSRLGDAVVTLQRIKTNVKRYKAAVLKAATEGRLVPTEAELSRREGRSYESAQQLLARILHERRTRWMSKGKSLEPTDLDTTKLSALPEGWAWTSVDQISIVVRGASPRPAGDPRYFGGGVPWITVGPITSSEDAYLRSVPGTVTDAGKERSRFIEPDTLLLTNSGATLGVPKISLIGGCINDGVAALLEVDYPTKLYLLYFLRTLTARLRGINQGAAQPNLNTSIIKSVVVPLPPLAEQYRIIAELERRLSVIREIQVEIDANHRRAERLRQAILKAAFGEHLRVF